MSELDALVESLIGDDEWSRHEMLERLRARGATNDVITGLATALAGDDSRRRAAGRMALAALASAGSPASDRAGATLVEGIGSADPDIRVLAASAMGESRNRAFTDTLVEALADSQPNVVAAAADALGVLRDPAAVDPLAELAAHAGFWVRAAAVVALGRFQDPRTIPALEAAGRTPGLAPAVVEALRTIDDPAALPALARLHEAAPAESLAAAGAILSSHPTAPAPDWVIEGARSRERELRRAIGDGDDPATARLLGLVGTPGAIHDLLTAAGPPRRSEAALNGLLAVDPERRIDPILEQVVAAEPEDQVALLSLLPPLVEPDAVERLVPLLSHPLSQVRAAAAEALARSPASHSLQALARELGRPHVAPEIVRASGALGATACVALIPLLDDDDPTVRAAAADALGRCAGAAIGQDLFAALDRETDPRPRRALLGALGRITKGTAVPALREALQDPDPETRVTVIEALGSTGSAEAIPDLASRLGGPPHERLAGIRALGEIADPAAARLVEPFLDDPDLETRRTAARALLPHARILPMASVEALADDPDAWLRGWAVRMLATRGEAARTVLGRLAVGDPDPAVRSEARRALERQG